jgi:beta-glucosidase
MTEQLQAASTRASFSSANRRSVLLGAGLVAGWALGPWRSLARAAEAPDGAPSPRLTALLAKMTVEEKAGQLTLMPAAIMGPATAFNPAQPPTRVAGQLAEAGGVGKTGVVSERSRRVDYLVRKGGV